MNHTTYKALRESIGTQELVAKRLGISLPTMKRREKPGSKISAEQAIALKALAAGMDES